MRVLRRLALPLILGLVPLSLVAFASRAGAKDHGGDTMLQSTLAPSQPTDPSFHGVVPGGLPWVLSEGEVSLRHDGRLRLEVRGLVIPIEHTVGGVTFPAGTARPVTTVSASLFCGADAETMPAATTGAVPISSGGNARIDARVRVPATCLAPIVLVHPNGGLAAYIAVTGAR